VFQYKLFGFTKNHKSKICESKNYVLGNLRFLYTKFIGEFCFYSFRLTEEKFTKIFQKENLLISLTPSLLFLHSLTLPLPAHLSLLFPTSTATLHVFITEFFAVL
jgi:hypothetical protein